MSVEDIWYRFHADLLRFIRARVATDEEAEDILQDVYLRIVQSIDTLKNTERVEAWIYRIARNRIVDGYRERHPAAELPEALADDRDHPEDVLFQESLRESVNGMMALLPDTYREALVMVEVRGLSQKAMADELGMSFSGAKSRVQRGREKLKTLLTDCCTFQLDHYGSVIDYYEHEEDHDA